MLQKLADDSIIVVSICIKLMCLIAIRFPNLNWFLIIWRRVFLFLKFSIKLGM